ncbi:ABC transporter permease [Alkaliphilus pronyensis]|uniref:ABC transporter permease n=1 Tax=Alkaliphilus pronyensis TaxID=1482732 RepID=A0A6I0FQL1_9FIRM|nr:ABC transporter permease [Alkaliphilus pronyensis]KAB3538614.1 ABC transporter permease [Alkaliphilus pronyensis]
MHRYIFRRLLLLIPVMMGVTFIIFTMMYFTPGDPARIMLGETAPEADVIRLREELGLDDPFLIQFGRYVKNAVIHQDIGRSYTSNRPVVGEITTRFPATLKLAALGVLVSVAIGIPTGIISATKQYSIFDNVAMVLALIGVSMPNFWQGLMTMLVFSVYLGWFPSSGFSTPMHWVLPAVTIGTASCAIVTRMTRSSMLEVIRQDYIRTARAKGQVESKIINQHALKNALIPVITVVGLQFGYLLGGAILTETIFAIPGVGRLMVEAVLRRDLPIVMGGVLFIAVTFSIVNLCVDILYAFVDPRIKSQYK